MKAFSKVGVDVKIGAGGIGFDVATPLGQKFNLRGTGYFFRYNVSLTEDYVTYGGDLQLAGGGVSLDWYPFNGKFRLSAGAIAYNGNQITASASSIRIKALPSMAQPTTAALRIHCMRLARCIWAEKPPLHLASDGETSSRGKPTSTSAYPWNSASRMSAIRTLVSASWVPPAISMVWLART